MTSMLWASALLGSAASRWIDSCIQCTGHIVTWAVGAFSWPVDVIA